MFPEKQPEEPGKKKSIRPAGIYSRLAAAAIDMTIWIIPWYFLHQILITDPETPQWSFTFPDKIIIPVVFLYFTIMESIFGKTIGKMVLKICVKENLRKKPTFKKSFFRNLLKVLSVLTFFVGYLMILFRNDAKSLHDLLTDTRVVKEI